MGSRSRAERDSHSCLANSRHSSRDRSGMPAWISPALLSMYIASALGGSLGMSEKDEDDDAGALEDTEFDTAGRKRLGRPCSTPASNGRFSPALCSISFFWRLLGRKKGAQRKLAAFLKRMKLLDELVIRLVLHKRSCLGLFAIRSLHVITTDMQ